MNLVSATKGIVETSSIIRALKPALPVLTFERHLGRGVSQNRRQKPRPPGLKRPEGDFVRRGEMIMAQFYLDFHPGLNVTIDNKNNLKAMVDGQVMMTAEKTNHKKGNAHVEKYYGPTAGPVFYKRYFHVLPFPQGRKFKLVDLV